MISVILITLSYNSDPLLINVTVIDNFAFGVAIFNVQIVLFRLFACNLIAPWCRNSPMLVRLSRFFDFFKPNRAIVVL